MEKTAVEWLIDMLVTENEVTLKGENYKLFNQAINIEKEQILNAAMWMPEPFNSIEFIPELAKQYYNNKYGDM
jgi:hypothetical protein